MWVPLPCGGRLWGEGSSGGRRGSRPSPSPAPGFCGPSGARSSSAAAIRSSWPAGPVLAASRDPLSLAGKPCEGSCCLQNRTRTPRARASLCPVAGRSQTPCAWALSSPRRASCEWGPSPRPPTWRTPAGPQRCLRERRGRWQSGAPSGQVSGARSAGPALPLQCFCPVNRTSLMLPVVQVCNINPVPSSCVCLLCSARGPVSQVWGCSWGLPWSPSHLCKYEANKYLGCLIRQWNPAVQSTKQPV